MAVLYGAYTTPRSTTPPGQVDGSVQGGHVRVYREKITLASQTTADTVVVAYPSKSETFLYGTLRGDTSLGTSTVAVGIAGSTGKYRAAATFTSTTAYEMFGVVAAGADKLAADEAVFVTIGTANLPASGTLLVDLYFAQT